MSRIRNRVFAPSWWFIAPVEVPLQDLPEGLEGVVARENAQVVFVEAEYLGRALLNGNRELAGHCNQSSSVVNSPRL